MEGFVFTEHGWVQSYGSRYVRPPIIHGDVSRPSAMTTKEFQYAQSLTQKPVKGMLTGTACTSSFHTACLMISQICAMIQQVILTDMCMVWQSRACSQVQLVCCYMIQHVSLISHA